MAKFLKMTLVHFQTIYVLWLNGPFKEAVFRIRKYFVRIRICGSVILNYNYGSRSGRPFNYRSIPFLDIVVAVEKNNFLNHPIIIFDK
jgi:hypothetical protein